MHYHYYQTSENSTCPSGYFRCKNGQCINATNKCDANQDCNDASDETKCGKYKFESQICVCNLSYKCKKSK